MNNFKIKIAILMLFSLIVFTANAQKKKQIGVTKTQLFQQMKRFDSEIEKLRNLSKVVAQSIDPERARIQASYTLDPQRSLDFILLRYERSDSYIQLALAEKARKAAQYLKKHRYDKHGVADIVLEQGINKYNDMCDFFTQIATELRNSFTEHWNEYCSKYGSADKEVFILDNGELATYGVSTK